MNAWLGPDLGRRPSAGRLPGAPLHEDVLRERLTRLVPDDRFEEDIEFTIISARKI
jgi:hypothetical protein